MKRLVAMAGGVLVAFVIGCVPMRGGSVAQIMRRAESAVRDDGAAQPRTLVFEGTYEYTGQQGQHGIAPYYQHWRSPGVLYQELQAPFGLMRRWFDGRQGWASRPEFPNRVLGDAELSETRRDAVLYQPWAMREEYSTMSYEGRQVREGREFDVIAAKSRHGKVERFWFDAATGLVRILDVWEEGPEGLRDVGGGEFYQTHYLLDDYRKVGAMTLPFRVRRIRPNSAIDMRFNSIRVDVPIDTLRERRPAGASDTLHVRDPR